MRSRAFVTFASSFALILLVPTSISWTGPAPGLDVAPEWRIGDWWLIELKDARMMEPVEARLVVSAVDKGDYFVGVEHGDPYLELLTYHFPFFGRVSARDLSYSVHNQPFHPLQFPIVKGDTWTTQFNDLWMDAEVVAVSEYQARVEFRSGDILMGTVTYDANAATITSWYLAGHGTLEVNDHGREFDCAVDYAPRHELLFAHHAMGSTVLPVTVSEPATVDVDRPFERAAIVLAAGGEEGTFSSGVVPPDGELRSVNVLPHDVERWRLALVETWKPMGTWHINSAASNQGFALSEAMGFDLRTVHLRDPKSLEFHPPGDCVSSKPRGIQPAVAFEGSAEDAWPATLLLGAALGGFVGVWFGLRRAAIWVPPLAALYAKIPKERVLESRIRSDIIDLLKQQPGLTTQEIRRTLMIGWGNTVHHLMILDRAGLVVGTSWGHNRHWFLQNEIPASGRTAISALRRDAARIVYDAIKKTPGISQEDLAKNLSIHHSTVFFHVERLMHANLVSKTRDGSRVRYFPTGDAVSPPSV